MFNTKDLAAAYANYTAPVVVAKMAAPRPSEKTFRNNKYSIYNVGRLSASLGKSGFRAEVDRV
jgi:hypothetical protein